MPSHLASEAWSNSEMAFSYTNDVIIVTQTALVWVILCLFPYLNQLFKFIVLWLPTMRLTLQSSAWTFTLTTEPAQKMQALISNNFSYKGKIQCNYAEDK